MIMNFLIKLATVDFSNMINLFRGIFKFVLIQPPKIVKHVADIQTYNK